MVIQTGIVAFAIAIAGVSQGNAPHPNTLQGGGGGAIIGQKDPQKLARLLTLLRNPQQSVSNLNRWAQAHRAATQTGAVPPNINQPNGSLSSNIHQGNVPTNNTTNTATAGGGGGGPTSHTPAEAPGNSMSNVGGAGTAGGGGGTIGEIDLNHPGQAQASLPPIINTRLGNVIGADKASLAQIDQLVGKDATQLQSLRGALKGGVLASALQRANIDVNTVIAVDVLPSGGLEVFTR